MRTKRRRGWRNIAWIERHCLVPHRPEKGQPVRLTRAQRDIVYNIYDGNTPGGYRTIGGLLGVAARVRAGSTATQFL